MSPSVPWLIRCVRVLLLGCGSWAIAITPVLGHPHPEIVSDGLLGTTVTCGVNCVITGGTQQGENLFHGFEKLKIPANIQADFQVPASVQRVFARVSSRTEIDGILGINLGVIPSQLIDFILISPKGFILRDDAVLDVKGAFLATTADRITFADQTSFGIDSGGPLSLTASLPEQLVMGNNPGKIELNHYTTSYRQQSSFALIGDNITLKGNRRTSPASLAPWEEGLYLQGYAANSVIALERHSLGDPAGSWGFSPVNQVPGNPKLTITHYSIQEAIESPSSRLDFLAGTVTIKDSEIYLNASSPRSANLVISGNHLRLDSAEIRSTATQTSGRITIDVKDSIRLDHQSRIMLQMPSPNLDYLLSIGAVTLKLNDRSIISTFVAAARPGPDPFGVKPVRPAIVEPNSNLLPPPSPPTAGGVSSDMSTGEINTSIQSSAMSEEVASRAPSKRTSSLSPSAKGQSSDPAERRLRCAADRMPLLRERGREGLGSLPATGIGGPIFVDYGGISVATELTAERTRISGTGEEMPLSPVAIVEAQAWQRNDRGSIQLIASSFAPEWSIAMRSNCVVEAN